MSSYVLYIPFHCLFGAFLIRKTVFNEGGYQEHQRTHVEVYGEASLGFEGQHRITLDGVTYHSLHALKFTYTGSCSIAEMMSHQEAERVRILITKARTLASSVACYLYPNLIGCTTITDGSFWLDMPYDKAATFLCVNPHNVLASQQIQRQKAFA